MKTVRRPLAWIAAAIVFVPAPAFAQSQNAERPGASGFVRDVLSDYKNFFSWTNAEWLGVGGIAALAVHPADDWVREEMLGPDTPSLSGGNVWGSQYFQVPLAVGVWAIGGVSGNGNVASTGRDLLRAQISAFSWDYVIKFATNRTRPNGDPRSFPSGHATASFAAAMVLQEHFGWKAGVPAFAMGAYTCFTRLTDNQHWLSDVVFGAALGMVSARTVTVRLRAQPFKVAPLAVRGGGGIQLVSVGAPK